MIRDALKFIILTLFVVLEALQELAANNAMSQNTGENLKSVNTMLQQMFAIMYPDERKT